MFLFQSSEEKKLKQDAKNQMEICLRSTEEKSQDKYKKAMQFLSKHIQKNNEDIIEIVVDNIKATIKDDQLPPMRKYQAIKLLRDLMKIEIKNKNKTLGKYVLKKIFKRLRILASHNAGSNEEDRGKDMFKGVKKDQEKYSVLFLNELLLAIEQWAKTWPGVSEGMKKQFNEAYKQLLTNGVKFPTEIVKGPQPQGYRGQDRSSLAAYSSVPKRQSFPKNQQKSPVRSVSNDQKPKKIPAPSMNQSSGKLNQKKVKDYFRDIIPPVEEFLMILGDIENGDDPEILSMLNDMINNLRGVIASGDVFCTQLLPQEMKTDFLGKGVISAIQYSQGATKDIKKLLKSNSQFSRFKSKYLKLGNELIKGLRGILNGQKNDSSIMVEKPKQERKVQTAKSPVQTSTLKVNQQEPASAKKLTVPRVSSQNMYSSISGQPNTWVIKERSQYNSNSHHDQHEAHEKFGSFGIGGIGQKIRNESKDKEKTNSGDKTVSEKPLPKVVVTNQTKPKKTQNQITKKFQDKKQQEDANQGSNKQNTFGSFKISSEQTSKPNQNFDESQPTFSKAPPKKNLQEVKDFFNESAFQEQQKVQLSREEKPEKLEQSGGFFGQFGDQSPIEKSIDQLPRGNRNQRKKTEIVDNPFESNMNSKVGNETQKSGAFNKERPSFGEDNSQNQVFDKPTSQVKEKNKHRDSLVQNERKKSFDDPFAGSFELSKSNRNSYDNQVPNFWDGQPERPNSGNIFQSGLPPNRNSQSREGSQKFSNNQSKSKIANPFQNPQFTKRASKSINPFEDDNKSEVSQKNRSSVLNFQVNKSFTKSERQNPFENPFETTSQYLSKTNQQPSNPFQTSKDQFKPPKQPQQFDSVSQQASFQKVIIPEKKTKKIPIQNPFETMTQNKSQIYEPKQGDQMNQSWKFSIKDKESNQGFDFEQFQNIPGQQRISMETSAFPAARESFNPNIEKKGRSAEIMSQIQNQKSIHFSQFGDQIESKNRQVDVAPKQGSKKSFNFSDFGGFEEKPSNKKGFSEFSGFDDVKLEKKKQELNAFELSKNSANDFFRQTQRFPKVDKPEDNKSQQSGFSAFNVNADNKSQKHEKSSVNWEDFGKFEKDKLGSNQKFDDHQRQTQEFFKKKDSNAYAFGTGIQTERSPQESSKRNNFIDKNQLRLQFSQNTSKYHSPEFNQKFDSVQKSQEDKFNVLNSLKKVETEEQQGEQSIKFEQFASLEKKGYSWNPLGLRPQRCLTKIMVCTEYDIEKKKKEVQEYKRIYTQEKQLIQKAKQLYNQARKVYLQKTSKIDGIIKQKLSYMQILASLKESNENKEEEIFLLNEKIKKVSQLKEKILEKEKLFFQKTKSVVRQEEAKNFKNRTNNNKWEIFNRNLKMMRQRELQGNQTSFSRTGYSYSRNY